MFITLNDRLYGGLTPVRGARAAAGRRPGSTTSATSLGRVPRALRAAGAELLRWAPFAALAFVGAVAAVALAPRRAWPRAVPEHVDVEVVAAFCGLAFGAQVLAAAFLAPRIDGAVVPGRLLVPVLPFAAALAAWGLRRFPHRRGARRRDASA